MFVCLCNGVTSQEIDHCCQSGAKTVEDLMNQTGAGHGCGGCKEYLWQEISKKNLENEN